MNKLLLLCIGMASAYNPGLTASLDKVIFDQAKQSLTNLLLEKIRKTPIPDFSFSQGEINQNTFALNDVTPDQIVLNVLEAENALTLTITGIGGEFHSGYFHVHESFLGASGHIDVTLQNVALTIGIGMTTQVGSDGRLLNAISAVHTSLVIDKDHCDISIGGSFFTEVAKMIQWMFKSKIIGAI